jgi:plastocyanin
LSGQPSRRRAIAVSSAIVLLGAFSWRAESQSVGERTPNLSGGWIAAPGVVQFNFIHRFEMSDPPLRKVTNVPTFFVGTGVTSRLMLGFAYAPNSQVFPQYPNEWEFSARYLVIDQDRGAPLTLAVQGGYNVASITTDAELQVSTRIGPLRLIGAARAFHGSDSLRYAIAGGVVAHLAPWLSLAGDAATLTSLAAGERYSWGAGAQIGIPSTPHSLSLHVTNVNSGTLQGTSRGTRTRVGFEYTIPITLRRYTGRGATGMLESGMGPVDPGVGPTGDTVRVSIRNLTFRADSITVPAGTVVLWSNDDDLAHTVTSDSATFDSGLLRPGASWTQLFSRVGRWGYHCMPHPFMQGVVIVRARSAARTGS